jgi:hypothetical protein
LTATEEADDFETVKAPPSLVVEDLSDADVPAPPSPWETPAAAGSESLVVPPGRIGAELEAAAEAGGPAAISEVERPAPPRAEPPQAAGDQPPAPERDTFEIDLSGDLDDLLNAAAAPLRPTSAAEAPREHPRGLEGFFEDLREEYGRDLEGVSAALAYDQASDHFNRGEVETAAAYLRTAARDPLYRFRAASMLARIARAERRLEEAVEWLERAAEAPAPTPEATHGLLYELGDLLDASREAARALAVFIELQAAAPGYRDVAERIAALSRRQAEPSDPERRHP